MTYRYHERLRVRWSEIDSQHIVFNAHYLTYADTAIAGYWRALGLPYHEAMTLLGGDTYLKKTTVEYHASALYDDVLTVGLRCKRLGTSSLVFDAHILRGDTLLTSIELVYVFADPRTQTSQPIPAALRQVIENFEAGKDITQLHLGGWDTLGQQAGKVRTAVFVQEQGIDAQDEWDAMDAQSLHAVLVNGLGQTVATGRLLPSEHGQAKIGRMAVLRVLRGTGQGGRILQALCAQALARGDTEVFLHAQRSSQGFYNKLGFSVVGEPFMEVGIAHVSMSKRLG
ncbi:MAG: YbgC/FadM family acyl-CoA thioesterase [Burkholderiaceae bacterium]